MTILTTDEHELLVQCAIAEAIAAEIDVELEDEPEPEH
jgi:hypothetical protein